MLMDVGLVAIQRMGLNGHAPSRLIERWEPYRLKNRLSRRQGGQNRFLDAAPSVLLLRHLLPFRLFVNDNLG